MSKIVNLSEAASIALHGMVLIAQSDKLVNVHEIAELTSSSKHHVAKVLQRLVKENYLTSLRGPRGGFQLKKSAKDITFLELYETIEGRIDLLACPMGKPTCPFDHCLLGNVTLKMTTDFRNYLKSQTVEMHI